MKVSKMNIKFISYLHKFFLLAMSVSIISCTANSNYDTSSKCNNNEFRSIEYIHTYSSNEDIESIITTSLGNGYELSFYVSRESLYRTKRWDPKTECATPVSVGFIMDKADSFVDSERMRSILGESHMLVSPGLVGIQRSELVPYRWYWLAKYEIIPVSGFGKAQSFCIIMDIDGNPFAWDIRRVPSKNMEDVK